LKVFRSKGGEDRPEGSLVLKKEREDGGEGGEGGGGRERRGQGARKGKEESDPPFVYTSRARTEREREPATCRHVTRGYLKTINQRMECCS